MSREMFLNPNTGQKYDKVYPNWYSLILIRLHVTNNHALYIG